jgi:drug/metabolite transporter (DMT)-like permease
MPLFQFTSEGWFWCLLGSAGDFFVATCYVLAYQADSTGFVSLLAYSSVVWSLLSDLLIFKQQFSALTLTFAMIIFATTLFMAIYKFK